MWWIIGIIITPCALITIIITANVLHETWELGNRDWRFRWWRYSHRTGKDREEETDGN